VKVESGQNYTQESDEVPRVNRIPIKQFRQPDTGKVPHDAAGMYISVLC